MRVDVLIAEADPMLRGAYEHVFAESGIRVETAADGLDCWTKLRACSPDALVVDVDILWGGSDGVLNRLSEDLDEAVNLEIFITGNDTPEILSKRVGIAVGRCFQKPLEVGTVLNSMCDVFASETDTLISWDPV